MRRGVQFKSRQGSLGLSMIELALVLPVLLLLVLGVVDFGRAILFNNILINMSREGANLASRTTQSPQFIIDALNHTASPVVMESHGMVYIARVKGVVVSGNLVNSVEEQYRAVSGDWSLASQLWACKAWAANGSCTMPPNTTDREVILSFPLAVGEEIHVVETLYDYTPLAKYAMPSNLVLYSQTLL